MCLTAYGNLLCVCSKGAISQFRTVSPNISWGSNTDSYSWVNERNWSYPTIWFRLLGDLPDRWETAVVNFIPSGAAAAHARCHQSPTGMFPGLKGATPKRGKSPKPTDSADVCLSFVSRKVRPYKLRCYFFIFLLAGWDFPQFLGSASMLLGLQNQGDVRCGSKKNTEFEAHFFCGGNWVPWNLLFGFY